MECESALLEKADLKQEPDFDTDANTDCERALLETDDLKQEPVTDVSSNTDCESELLDISDLKQEPVTDIDANTDCERELQEIDDLNVKQEPVTGIDGNNDHERALFHIDDLKQEPFTDFDIDSNEQTPVDTTESSNSGETHFRWDSEQQKLINAHRAYHFNMLRFIEELDKNGPDGLVMPKKPNVDLKSLFGDHENQSNLTGKDLHIYLTKNLCSVDPGHCPIVSRGQVDHFTSLQDSLEALRSKFNSNSLSASLDYGEWLNVAFERYHVEKPARTWKEWLDKEVGINESYARKLREISRMFRKYTRFRNLGLSFSEVYRRKKQIERMLITDSSLAQFWQ